MSSSGPCMPPAYTYVYRTPVCNACTYTPMHTKLKERKRNECQGWWKSISLVHQKGVSCPHISKLSTQILEPLLLLWISWSTSWEYGPIVMLSNMCFIRHYPRPIPATSRSLFHECCVVQAFDTCGTFEPLLKKITVCISTWQVSC